MEERKLLQSVDEMENDFAILSQFWPWGLKIKIGGFDFEMGIYMEERKLLLLEDEMENDFTIWSQLWGSEIEIVVLTLKIGDLEIENV